MKTKGSKWRMSSIVDASKDAYRRATDKDKYYQASEVSKAICACTCSACMCAGN